MMLASYLLARRTLPRYAVVAGGVALFVQQYGASRAKQRARP